jgi:hypothetical protein
MRSMMTILMLMVAASALAQDTAQLTKPIVGEDVVFEEVDGVLAIEAEHFYDQSKTEVRAFYLTTADQEAGLEPDADPSHVAGASGGAYLEIQPDTRKNHGEKLIGGENFSNDPGLVAVLSYKVHFNNPGRYYIWGRVNTTGTEDNGVHFGLDGQWPETSRRMQAGGRGWQWGNKQRTEEVHTGVPWLLYLDIEKAGAHTIHVSMREDGFELDKFVLASSKEFKPEGTGPEPKLKSGELPKPFKMVPAPAEQPAASQPAASQPAAAH